MDSTTLQRLRDAIVAIKSSPDSPRVTRATAATALSQAAAMLPPGMGLTVDFSAADVLGQPLVILRPSRAPDPCFAALTPREREVAGLVAAGLRNKDIALALGIAVGTVKDHVHAILRKSGLDGRAAVAGQWSAHPTSTSGMPSA